MTGEGNATIPCLSLCLHDQAFCAEYLAGALVRDAVNDRAALEANAHAAKRSARRPRDRYPAIRIGREHGRGDACSLHDLHRVAIHGNDELLGRTLRIHLVFPLYIKSSEFDIRSEFLLQTDPLHRS